ncbi:MAG: FtsX-like permease family protein [Lachnospiraceae bacterium]|nr:FtsX-like permease family protein [Lachnospiraceae bacterium]
MKISAFWKSSLREIKHSLGRFMAIFGIVTLGVGFFVGLKVTRDVMVTTTNEYYEDRKFYDYRLLSTLGFDKEAVKYIKTKEYVRTVAGAVSFDIMYRDSVGNDQVLRAHSISEGVNEIVITGGRMPESPDECVLDDLFFGESSIGDTIYLSEANEEGDMANFRFKEYQVVGICKSPLYIHYDRGTSSVGNGKVASYVYMLPEAFDADYYTELYVKLDTDAIIYSEEYDKYKEGPEKELETLAAKAAKERYPRVLEEGIVELADGRQTLADEEVEAREELDKAWQKLTDAKAELEDAEKELDDGRKELDEGRMEIDKNLQKLEKNEKLLADKEKELEEGWKAYEEGYAAWQENKEKTKAADAELTAQATALLIQKAKIAEQEGAIAFAEGSMGGNMDMKPEVGEQLSQGKELIAAAKVQIAGYEAQINQGKGQIAEAYKALDVAYEELKSARNQLREGEKALENGKKEIEEGRKELEDAKVELEEAEITWQEGQDEYEKGLKEYEEGLQKYEDGKAEFEEEIADAKNKLLEAEADLAALKPPDVYVLGRNTNTGYVCFENDSAIITGIANVLPFFFFLVAALVCVTTMNRMVEEQRTQIGVLKALGYSRFRIMSKYFLYAGLAAVAGCAVGYFGGSYVFPAVIWFAYGIMYRIDSMVYILDPGLGVAALAGALAASLGSTWWTCRSELAQVAAQLIRPKAPQAGKRIFLEYLPVIWNRLGFLKKVSIRNIFRYKKRLFMMVTGISGCTALLVTGYGVKDSIANVVNQQYQEIHVYDISVDYKEEVKGEQLEDIAALPDVDSSVLLSQGSIEIVTDEAVKTVNLVIFNQGEEYDDFVKLHTADGNPVEYPAHGEAVISDKVAGKLGLSVGSEIRLRTEDMDEFTVRIGAIHQNFVNNFLYITDSTYEEGLDRAPEKKTVYINAANEDRVYELAAQLMNRDGVLAVTVNRDTMEMLDNMMESLDLIVIFLIACAAGLAFIVLYNLTNINIMERIREIATIKVLGFYKNETRSYVFRENLMLSFMGALAGLVLGKWFHSFVMAQVNIDLVSFDVHIEPVSYVYSLLWTLGFALFVGLVMGKKLEDISMTESLKSVD